MGTHILDIVKAYLPKTGAVGIVGVGKTGESIRQYALSIGLEVLLCDLPRAYDAADELSGHFFDLWGNGMGGCDCTGGDDETFLPLEALARADVVTIQVPLVETGQFPTVGLLTTSFLQRCHADVQILCLSNPLVIEEAIRNDGRILYF